jgi:hypothetical protein
MKLENDEDDFLVQKVDSLDGKFDMDALANKPFLFHHVN